ncbi:saccharopine dehydrogenase NADP-binding domain-containing protein [Marinicella sp. W31]|uniref:saccharopine dehydrogenase family protein n=1 Tax=Marinicella sp. W31 TaxID=3023713 RepID=UPI003756D2E8
MKRVLIIGGYGHFGGYIAKELAQEDNIQLIIAGRSDKRAQEFCQQLNAVHPAEAYALDIQESLTEHLLAIKPFLVIHTSGPFQSQDYAVAKACIQYGCHYVDLADGRDFVNGIKQLHAKAQRAGVLVVSGASSVPAFSAAIIDHYKPQFSILKSMDYGISTAQQSSPGLATTQAILGYAGKPFETLKGGDKKIIYGWQGLTSRTYTGLGKRYLSYCDIPDLSLFVERYPKLESIEFRAGLELGFVHITLWLLSFLVRIKLFKSLRPMAVTLLKISSWFNRFGSGDSAFHMLLAGEGVQGEDKKVHFELIAKDGHGAFIPCIPAILLAHELLHPEQPLTGAFPCMGLITFDAYLERLKHLNIHWSCKAEEKQNAFSS